MYKFKKLVPIKVAKVCKVGWWCFKTVLTLLFNIYSIRILRFLNPEGLHVYRNIYSERYDSGWSRMAAFL